MILQSIFSIISIIRELDLFFDLVFRKLQTYRQRPKII